MKYSISVLGHNNCKMTERCLRSVVENSHDYELILTNNGSTDDTALLMQSCRLAHPNCVYIQNPANKGFIQPNNLAVEIAHGDFTIFLNNDTTVPAGWLDALEAPFLHDKNCAISGATGCALNDDFIGHQSRNVEYIEGSCLMIRTSLAREIGLFDPKLVGAYGEDADLGLRVRKIGYNIHTVPINIQHLGGATSAMVPQAHEWMTRNLSYLKTKWADYLRTRTFDHAYPNAPH